MYFLSYIKKLLRKSVLLIIVLSVANTLFCQDNLNALAASFNQYAQHTSQEQLFVHTDKQFYLAGEILWFKMYAADITYHKPVNISKVAYAEMLNTANKPVLQAKIALQGGTGDGSLFLPLTLPSGNYKLRAYTNWMKNAGPDVFFEKIITVVNVQRIAERTENKNINTYSAQFFPEGGNLVAGLESKVAFKVFDQWGKGVPASGYIFDNGDTAAKFTTAHAGMGNFCFKPLINHTYKAVVQIKNGTVINQDMPAAYSTGCVMSMSSDADKITVTVHSNSAASEVVYLLVHTGSSIKVAEQTTLQNGSAAFTFNPSALGEGIAHLTIFNSNRQPLCERLYFKKPAAYLDIAARPAQNEYEKRDKVYITVGATSIAAKDSAMLSMAVYRLDSIQSVDENTINTYLLLSSALRGNVEDIQYYFGEGKQVSDDLNNLLLVNGWSRFKWEAILENTKPAFAYVPEYNGHIISGKVINSKTGLGEKDVETYLSFPGLKTQFIPALSDDNGNVRFEVKDCFGSSEIIAQTKEQNEAYKIQIDAPFSTVFTPNIIPAFALPEKNPATLLEQSISMQVQNIYLSNKRNQLYSPVTDTAAFYASPDSKYLLDNFTRFTTMEEVLREYITLVNLTKRSGKYHIEVFDKGHDVVFKDDPLVLLDGVPVSDFNKLLTVDPLRIKSLDVVQKKYFLGSSDFNGILNWKTYTGDIGGYELDPAAVVIDYEGLQLEREFYAPVYDKDKSSAIPDFRNVLYWNPNIKIAAGKAQTLSFYTSDLPGKYAVVTQGLSSGGLCGSTIATFDVKE